MKKIKLFAFIVKRLGFLKAVPLLPHMLEAALKIEKLIIKSDLPGYIDDIETELSEWQGVTIGLHKYGGIQFNYNGKEMGHIHGNGLLDIRFSRVTKSLLLAENRIQDHHVFTDSGWISFYIRTIEDRDYALILLKMAYQKSSKKVQLPFAGQDKIGKLIILSF